MKLSEDVSRQGISALCQLNLLEEFIFKFKHVNINHYLGMLAICYDLLPNLHVAGIKPRPFDTSYVGSLQKRSSTALLEITLPRTLRLHHLVLSTLSDLPEHIALPEVQVLHLCEPKQRNAAAPGSIAQID